METPDKFIVLRIPFENSFIYKVFATWYGGYGGADEWRMNSGISKIELENTNILFYGNSGSCYKCNKNTYGTNMYSQGVLELIIKQAKELGKNIEIMPDSTDWKTLLNKIE